MEFLENINITNKRVLIRVDFNVPIGSGEVLNDFRIKKSLETIKYCLEKNAAVILMSHLGRPKGIPSEELSLEAVCWHLEDLLDTPVSFVRDCISEKAFNMSKNIKGGEILLLENLRFYNEEASNDQSFSKQLAKHGDIYINDAFGTAHREHASNVGVLDFFKTRGYGFLIDKELKYLKNELEKPAKPLVVLIGGSKISTKIALIDNLLDKADTILIGGAMAFTFQKALGFDVGNSMVEDEQLKVSLDIINRSKTSKANLLFPADFVCAKDINDFDSIEVKMIDSFDTDDIGLDIGPETCMNYEMYISSAKTIIWNGPMGMFEVPNYSTGTQALARSIEEHGNNQGATTIIGGGDTVTAIENLNPNMDFTHISTGGGSSLELLSGKLLPALKEVKF